jgi:hypothetical protein
MFHNFPGSMICHYPVNRLEVNTYADWMRNHLSSHHAANYVQSYRKFRAAKL